MSANIELRKIQAKRLTSYIKERHNRPFQHGHSLHAIAAMLGYENWQTFIAVTQPVPNKSPEDQANALIKHLADHHELNLTAAESAEAIALLNQLEKTEEPKLPVKKAAQVKPNLNYNPLRPVVVIIMERTYKGAKKKPKVTEHVYEFPNATNAGEFIHGIPKFFEEYAVTVVYKGQPANWKMKGKKLILEGRLTSPTVWAGDPMKADRNQEFAGSVTLAKRLALQSGLASHPTKYPKYLPTPSNNEETMMACLFHLKKKGARIIRIQQRPQLVKFKIDDEIFLTEIRFKSSDHVKTGVNKNCDFVVVSHHDAKKWPADFPSLVTLDKWFDNLSKQ